MKGKSEYSTRHSRKIKRENIQLKKTVRRLRKIIDQLDVYQFNLEEETQCTHDLSESCERCGNHTLNRLDVSRIDGKFYIDICTACEHRSSLTKNENV